jgi:hypothetical protein
MNIEIKALSSIYLSVLIKTRVFDWMVLLPRALGSPSIMDLLFPSILVGKWHVLK